MLALIYLAVAVYFGDHLCRRFFRFVSVPHRWAAAVLVGLLLSSWFTYLAALAFVRMSRPLLWGDLLFFFVAIVARSFGKRKTRVAKIGDPGPGGTVSADLYLPRAEGSNRTDWVLLGAYLALASWMMFASLNSNAGKLQIANNEFSDFGPNTAIMQSFAVGHNFPTEYPHFSGDRIRYHFLFYFQAGNLESLGLDPAWSLNLLSILSLVAMLTLVMVLGEALFHSRAVGRVGSALFFFFGSLSYIPFLHRQASMRAAISSIMNQRDFLPSIFPYRGELWGVWSQVTYLNQRHLASAVGLLLLVLIFLVLCYRAVTSEQPAPHPSAASRPMASALEMPVPSTATEPSETTMLETAERERFRPATRGFIFSGVLLGLLPMWNSAVFLAALAVLACLFILCPLRPKMLTLAITSGVIALPQVIYLSTGIGRVPAPSLIHWGYTLDNPTIWNAANYLGFTFGLKWLLMALALVFATGLQRRIFVAVSSLIAVAFVFQLTVEVLANQKFLHIWAIVANLFVAYGLWRLWHLNLIGSALPGRLTAIVFVALIVPGGVIDFFPIHNAYWTETAYRNDPLIEWLTKETKPRDIFLTDRFVNHPLLMTGRRVFYGWPYYGWSAGYRAGERDSVYRQLWQERNPHALLKLLHQNNISYVVIDDGVRHGEFGRNLNETVYRKRFPIVFKDPRFGSIVIFKVPENDKLVSNVADKVSAPIVADTTSEVTMFVGGKGAGRGQFDWPRGIAADNNGSILVADTNNARIQRFSPDGVFAGSFGRLGTGEGEFREPNAVAVDHSGNIYVADFLNRRVQKLKPDGTFVAEWKGPEDGIAPVDISIGTDNSLYVVDEAHARIVKLGQEGNVLAVWGSQGSEDGQFNPPTSVAVDDTNNRVYVADPVNRRIEVFDTNGRFIANWSVPEWRPAGNAWHLQHLIVDSKAGRLYATSTQTDEVLVFDLAGKRMGVLRPARPDKLEGASALALLKNQLYVTNTFAARISRIGL